MKIGILVFVVSLFLCQTSRAQEETLMGSGEISSGGFGAPVVKLTEITGDPAVLVGGRGGWIINHTFVLGAGGYGLVTTHKTQDPLAFLFPYGETVLSFGYGGLELEYIIQSDKLLHYSVYLLLGGGAVSYRNKNSSDEWDDLYDIHSPEDAFFVVESAVNLELNVASFFRINAGIGYRSISGLKFDSLGNADFSGMTGTLALKFGGF
jgi:hypothetical protein